MASYSVKDISPKKLAEGVAVRIIHGERMSIGFFTIAKGAGVPTHSHPNEQIGTVLKGKMEFTIAGEKHVVSAGGAYLMPSGVVHSGLCVEGPAELIEVFSPVREDWKRA